MCEAPSRRLVGLAPPRAAWPQPARRTRLLLALAGSFAVASVSQPQALLWLALLALLPVVGLCAAGKLPSWPVVRRLASVNAFMLLVLLTLPWHWTAQGPVVDTQGLQTALQIVLRANAVALWCIACLAGFDALGLARSAAALHLPPRLVTLLLLMVRYIDLLAGSHGRLAQAMRCRGWQPRADRRTLQLLAQMLVLLLVQALHRGEQIERAMRARGYKGRMPRLHGDTPGWVDAACILALLLAWAGTMALG